MRNEYAAAPYFAALGPLVPRTLAVDFTHQLVDRDYVFQTLLDGVPAADGLDAYPRSRQGSYYRQLGSITRAIHDVRGERFGRPAGPGFPSWSQALADEFATLVDALDGAGLDSADARRVAAAVQTHRAVLDAVDGARLLHGDLWRLNILIDPHAAEPTIVGICDWDGASWGDPLADWTIHQVRLRSGTEVDAFWDTYGAPAGDAAGTLRQLFYEARHLIGARLDIHRRGIDLADVPPVHWDLSEVLSRLREYGAQA
jgi:aminoglycoside phosphotransferase (APT) family kinase protein